MTATRLNRALGTLQLGRFSTAAEVDASLRVVAHELAGADVLELVIFRREGVTFLEDQGVADASRLVAAALALVRTNGNGKLEPGQPRTQFLCDVSPEPVEWLWRGRLPLGKLVILDGDPGLGKSSTALDIAAHVTTGRAFPDGCPCERGSVVLLTAEDSLADTVR